MTNDELNEIVERVRQRLYEDPQNDGMLAGLLATFEGLSSEDKERMANVFGEAFWAATRSRSLDDAKQHVTTRYLFNGSEITTNLAGTVVGLTGGKGQFDIVNMIGATGWIDSATNARQVNYIVGSGGAFCLDYLVSGDWATEVAAGRGVEGQTIRTIDGGTFKIYSTLNGAIQQTDDDGFTGSSIATILVCGGTYAEEITVPASVSLNIVGIGMKKTIIGGKSTATNYALDCNTNNSIDLWLSNLTIEANTNSSAARGGLNVGFGTRLFINDCELVGANNGSNFHYAVNAANASGNLDAHISRCWVRGSYGLNWQNNVLSLDLHSCWFQQNTIGLRVQEYARVRDCHFDGCTTAIVIGNDTSYSNDVAIDNCYFGTCTTGIFFEGANTNLSAYYIRNNWDLNSGAHTFIDASEYDSGTEGHVHTFRITNNHASEAGNGSVFLKFATTIAEPILLFGWVVKGNSITGDTSSSIVSFYTGDVDARNAANFWSDNYHSLSAGHTGGSFSACQSEPLDGAPTMGFTGGIYWVEGLNPVIIGVSPCTIRFGDTITAVTRQTTTLTASATCYVEINSAGTLSHNTSGFTAGSYPVVKITTGVSLGNSTFVSSEDVGGILYVQRAAGGGVPAAASEPFVTIGNSANLSAERALTAGSGIAITDGGANSTVTVKAMRTATVYVASADATAAEIAAADYACDNTSDNVQIQAALDELSAAGSGRLILSSGTFTVDAASISLYNNITIEGQGRYATTVKLANSIAGANRQIINDSTSLSNITIRGITWDGNKGNQTDGADRNVHPILNLGAKTNLIIQDCGFQNCYAGAALRLISACTHVLIEGCYFTGNGKATPTAGFECDDIYHGSCVDVMIRNNVLLDCTDTGIANEACSYCTVTGNYINVSTGSQSLAISPSSTGSVNYITVANNILIGSGSNTGMQISDFSNVNDIKRVILDGNNIVAHEPGIFIGNAAGSGKTVQSVVIANNHIESGAGKGIEIGSVSDDVLIINNKFNHSTAGSTGITFNAGHTATGYNIIGNDVSTPAAGGITGTIPTGALVIGNKGYTTHDFYTDYVHGGLFKPSGLTGATAASRYVGATASGAPASGTFVVGDYVIDQTGKIYICTVAGTPGTWVDVASVAAAHAFVGTGHTGDDDYTLRPNVLGIGVSTGDIKIYSDAGSTQVGEWDGATGHIGVGTTASTTFGINVVKSIASTNARGAYVELTGTGAAGAGVLAALGFKTITSYSSGSQLLAAGLYGIASHQSAQALTTLVGVYSALESSAGGSGAITSAAAFYANTALWSGDVPATTYVLQGTDQGGTGATAYGIYLPAQTGTAARSFIADPLVIGTDAAPPNSEKLTVTGGGLAVLNDNELRLYDTGSSNYIGLRADSARTTDLVYILPATDPTAGQILSASAPAAGVVTLSWAADATGAGAVATDAIWDAKGDLAVGTGANTAVAVTVGANDTILMADSGQAAGVKWAAAATTSEIADVATTEAAGTSDTYARGDHVHKAAHSGIDTTSMKQTIVLTAAGGKPATTSGCAAATLTEAGTNDVDYWTLDFDATTKEYAVWMIAMPDNYDGSTITAKFIWTTTSSTATHDVRWGLQGRSFGDSETIDQAYGTAQEVSDTATATAGQVLISAATAAITLGGTPAGGEFVIFRGYRDPAHADDDMNVDARLLAIQIEYGVNALSA